MGISQNIQVIFICTLIPLKTEAGLLNIQVVQQCDQIDDSYSYTMKQRTLRNVYNCLNTNIYSYLETSGGKSYNLYLKCCSFFSTPVLIRHLWQLKTVVFLHWCLIHAILLVTPHVLA